MTTSKDNILEKVARIEERFRQIEKQLSEIDIKREFDSFQSLSKEHATLSPTVQLYHDYLKLVKELDEAQKGLNDESDESMKAMFRDEINRLSREIDQTYHELVCALIPKDSADDKNIMLEIRAGTGGDEAGLFVGNLLRMYEYYAASQNWKVESLSLTSQGIGGYREAIVMIKGKNVYSKLKFEAGVHRVQRVPDTETQGRIHTSTVTVAVLPEADEVVVDIDPNDLRIDVYRSSGPGGQSVNTTDSAVRITHIPTGIVVAMQDEKSQHKNKAKALKILRNRLYANARAQQQASIASDRKAQVGTGERSERIRTYNFPQNRITDHRIGLTLYELTSVMEGGLNPIIDPLIADFQAKQVEQLANNKT